MNRNNIQLSPLSANDSSTFVTGSIFEDNSKYNAGGSTISNLNIQQSQSVQSQSLRQLSKQRDMALKEQQKMSKSLTNLSRVNSSSKKTIKALRMSNEELQDSVVGYKRIIAQQQKLIHRLQQRFHTVNKTLATFKPEPHNVIQYDHSHPSVKRRRNKMKLLTVENDTEKSKSEVASATKANRSQISRISSRSLGSNDRLFRNAISALAKEKELLAKKLQKSQKKHLETKAELKDARNANKKLQKRLHMHENQTTFSGTLPPDVKSATSLAREKEALLSGSDGDNSPSSSKKTSLGTAQGGQIEGLLKSMLASEGEKLGRHEQHLIKTIRHMENLFEIVHDLSAITKITDLMGAIEHRVSKLLSVGNPFKSSLSSLQYD